jgi:CHASE3 domain sensor protein
VTLSELAATVELVEAGHAAAAIERVHTNLGKQEMDAIRAEVEALQADANIRLAEARATTRSPQRWVNTALACIGVRCSASIGGSAEC